MKVKELDRRVMLELIEHKYKELKTNKIKIDENEINYSSDEIIEILISLEKVTNDKVKLLSITPQNDKPIGYDESDRGIEEKLFALKKKYPDYFYINYNSNNLVLNIRNGKEIITLSKNQGLCRIIDKKEFIYPIKKKRYEILNLMTNKFISTNKIAQKLEEKDEQKIRVQIGNIRRIISKKLKFGKNVEFIETSPTGSGYRINNSFILEKR